MPSSEDRRHSRRPRGVVPYKPALLELIQGKNQWQTDPRDAQPNDGRRGWHQRGYLPHRDQPGLTQFVTFRLADSFPAELRSEWEALLATGQERDRQQLRKLEEYLDLGRGQC